MFETRETKRKTGTPVDVSSESVRARLQRSFSVALDWTQINEDALKAASEAESSKRYATGRLNEVETKNTELERSNAALKGQIEALKKQLLGNEECRMETAETKQQLTEKTAALDELRTQVE